MKTQDFEETIGDYKIVSVLGSDEIGVVYQAISRRNERKVAIRTFLNAFADDPGIRLRLDLDLRMLANLYHPNIVTVFDIGEFKNAPYIVMELIEGKTVDSLIQSGVKVPVQDSLVIIKDVCAALGYAHSRGFFNLICFQGTSLCSRMEQQN
jgi:serine/threonine protein kinase